MANDGWFKCDKCGDAKKVLVRDDVKVLVNPCSCGGTYRKIGSAKKRYVILGAAEGSAFSCAAMYIQKITLSQLR